MSDYEADRRLFHVMKLGGWTHDKDTSGFCKGKLWVSWGQAEDALRLADEGEAAVAVVGQSQTLAKIIAGSKVANDR
jgi:hypothetical protein